MGMFKERMPRGFQHSYIYHDERKEKLDNMREQARRELGMASEKPFSPEDIRGKFVEQTKYLKRWKQRKHRPASALVMLVVIVLLFFLMKYLGGF